MPEVIFGQPNKWMDLDPDNLDSPVVFLSGASVGHHNHTPEAERQKVVRQDNRRKIMFAILLQLQYTVARKNVNPLAIPGFLHKLVIKFDLYLHLGHNNRQTVCLN
jgi:hypothetical protein